MPIAIIADDGAGKPATLFTISDEMLATLEQFRQTVKDFNSKTGEWDLRYASINELIVGVYRNAALPLLEQFPLPSVEAKKQAVEAARMELKQAQDEAILGVAAVGAVKV